MKATIKIIAALATMAFATPAIAGGVNVYNDGESKLKIEALIYANTFSQTDDRITAGTSKKIKTAGLHIDRAYFTAKYTFNEDWMMRLTTDMGNEAALGKDQNIYLKYAYVEGKLAGKAAVLRVGQSHTPWIDYEQGLWKHRYVAKVTSDTYKFDTSADLGFGLKGKLAGGMVDYFVTTTNGTGYGKGNPTAGLNGFDFNSRIGLHPVKGLDIDFQYLTGEHGTKVTNGQVVGATTQGIKSTFTQAMISYGTKEFRVGANYLMNKDKAKQATTKGVAHGGNVSSNLKVTALNDEVKSTGSSVWAWAKIPGTPLSAFGRFESMKNEKTGVVNKEKITRYVAGLEYSPVKNITFAAVVDAAKLTNRGGVTTTTDKDTRFGLYSQIKL